MEGRFRKLVTTLGIDLEIFEILVIVEDRQNGIFILQYRLMLHQFEQGHFLLVEVLQPTERCLLVLAIVTELKSVIALEIVPDERDVVELVVVFGTNLRIKLEVELLLVILLLSVEGEASIFAAQAFVNELEIISLHLEEGRGDDAIRWLRVLILERHFFALILHIVQAPVDFNAARDDRLLATTYLRFDSLQLLAFEERVARKCDRDAKLLPRVVNVHFNGDGQRIQNLVG